MSKNILEDITVLVVDNYDKSREELREVFQTAGYNCLAASDGKEALQMLEVNDVDLVLTEVDLPIFDGIRLTENIKERLNIKVIMMSGRDGEFTRDDALATGAGEFMQKPLDIRELLELAANLLKTRS